MSGINKMDAHLTGMWVSFFTAAGIPSDVSATYALTFTENRIQNDMLLDLNKEYLRDMGITRMGDVIAILRHAKQVHESTARDKVLSTTVAPKVPVAAVTGRSTVTQPSSPASRILEHYTRQAPESPTRSAPALQPKRKSTDAGLDSETSIKKSRLIRFASPPQPAVKEAASYKTTVFSRLGNSEAKVTSAKVAAKPIYERLGSKPEGKPDQNPAIPVPKDALKYEGILKSAAVVKKVVTVTTSKNNIRKIAMGCTMRADEAPLSVKEKLALPKSKSVKFSNQIQYKEIEPNQKVVKQRVFAPKAGTVFNKPERRLSMPESEGVKARLGQVAKSANNLTITRNVFNRLGM